SQRLPQRRKYCQLADAGGIGKHGHARQGTNQDRSFQGKFSIFIGHSASQQGINDGFQNNIMVLAAQAKPPPEIHPTSLLEENSQHISPYFRRMRSIRRRGSAAPQSNWSPMTKAETYSGPILSLRTRPTPISRPPVMEAGVSSCSVSFLSFGTNLT